MIIKKYSDLAKELIVYNENTFINGKNTKRFLLIAVSALADLEEAFLFLKSVKSEGTHDDAGLVLKHLTSMKIMKSIDELREELIYPFLLKSKNIEEKC